MLKLALTSSLAAVVLFVASPAFAGVPRVVYDDISNSYFALNFEVPPPTVVDSKDTKDNNGHGNNVDGVDSSNPAAGKDNNGHGNNVDGVDSSNPGQGQGGPNADGADSDPTVDDEGKGGGAAPSKDKNQHQNQNQNQNQNSGEGQSQSKSSSKSASGKK